MKILKNKKILDISEATPEDAAEILSVLKQIGGQTDFLVIDNEGISLTEEQEKEYIKKCNNSLTSKLFVGKVDGRIVTVAGFEGSDRIRIKHNVSLGISVLKEFWNLEIAQHMMNYMLAFIRTTGFIKNVTLEVRADNENAIHIYQKFGFKKIGAYTNKFFAKDKFYDSVIMELLI